MTTGRIPFEQNTYDNKMGAIMVTTFITCADATWRLVLRPRLNNMELVKQDKPYLRRFKWPENQPAVFQLYKYIPEKHFPAQKYGGIEIVKVPVTGPATTLKRKAVGIDARGC